MRTCLIIYLCLLFTSCSVNSYNMDMDQDIPAPIRKEIEILNHKVIDAIATNEQDAFSNMLSDQLLKASQKDIPLLMSKLNEIVKYSSSYKIQHQFYTVNSTENTATSFINKKDGSHNYTINFRTPTKQNILCVIEFAYDYQQFVLIVIYGKYNDGWKLNLLQAGDYKVLSMDAVDWYEKSQALYKSGSLLDAVNMISLSKRLSRPYGFFLYEKDKEISAFYDKLMKEASEKYTLPMSVPIASNPSIYRISPTVNATGYYPYIHYRTNFNFSDSVALEKECDYINEKAGELFTGINTQNDSIAYQATTVVDGKERFWSRVKAVK